METVCGTYYNMHTVLHAILSLKRITAYEPDIILSFCMYYPLCKCKSLLFGMEGTVIIVTWKDLKNGMYCSMHDIYFYSVMLLRVLNAICWLCKLDKVFEVTWVTEWPIAICFCPLFSVVHCRAVTWWQPIWTNFGVLCTYMYIYHSGRVT